MLVSVFVKDKYMPKCIYNIKNNNHTTHKGQLLLNLRMTPD